MSLKMMHERIIGPPFAISHRHPFVLRLLHISVLAFQNESVSAISQAFFSVHHFRVHRHNSEEEALPAESRD